MSRGVLPKSARATKLRLRIEQWRKSATGARPRMPEELWRECAALAATDGLRCAANFLGVNHKTLRSRLAMHQQSETVGPAARPPFVEIAPISTPIIESNQPQIGGVLELTGAGGDRLRIEWPETAGVDVVGVVRLWLSQRA